MYYRIMVRSAQLESSFTLSYLKTESSLFSLISYFSSKYYLGVCDICLDLSYSGDSNGSLLLPVMN